MSGSTALGGHLYQHFNAGYSGSRPYTVEQIRNYFYYIHVDFIIIEKLDEAYLRWKSHIFTGENSIRIVEFNNEQCDLREALRINRERIKYLKYQHKRITPVASLKIMLNDS